MISHFFPDIFRLLLEPTTASLPVIFLFLVPQQKKIFFPQDQIKSTYKGTGKCSEPGVLDETSAPLRTTLQTFWSNFGVFWCVFDVTKKWGEIWSWFFCWAGKKGWKSQEMWLFWSFRRFSLITMTSHCLKIYRKSRFSGKKIHEELLNQGNPKCNYMYSFKNKKLACEEKFPGLAAFLGTTFSWGFFGPKTWILEEFLSPKFRVKRGPRTPNEQWKKPWLVRVYIGQYTTQLYRGYNAQYKDPY